MLSHHNWITSTRLPWKQKGAPYALSGQTHTWHLRTVHREGNNKRESDHADLVCEQWLYIRKRAGGVQALPPPGFLHPSSSPLQPLLLETRGRHIKACTASQQKIAMRKSKGRRGLDCVNVCVWVWGWVGGCFDWMATRLHIQIQ